MTIEEKQQEIIDEFNIYDDWIRESTAFEDQTLVQGLYEYNKWKKEQRTKNKDLNNNN